MVSERLKSMEKNIKTQVKVGIFVSAGIILSMFVIFMLDGKKSFFESSMMLFVKFKDISGLRSGATVSLAGVNVGTVKDIRFPQSIDDKMVVVELEVQEKYKSRIRQDSEAAIMTQGLLGDKMVFIKVGTPDSPEIKEGETLRTGKLFSIDSFAEDGGEMLADLKSIAKNVNIILKDVKEKKSFLHALIYDYKGEDIIGDIALITRSAGKLVKEIESGKGVLHALIYDKADPHMAKNLSVSIGNVKKATDNLNEVTQRIEKGEGTIGGLINDPTVYYDLKTLLGNANRSKLIKAVIRYTLLKNEKEMLQ